jgi:2-polyprenyl-3-methyl-5-hydroxy-6-metoxy-1,4-benzoquinol methylase
MNSSVKIHFDYLANKYDTYKKRNNYYYSHLKNLLAHHIPQNKKILEIGCGTGDLLQFLQPSRGVGIDLSPEMIKIAKKKHPQKSLTYISTPIEKFKTKETFDYIYMSDVIEHLSDTKSSFQTIGKLMSKNTVFINTMVNPIWEMILMPAEKLKLKMPEGPHTRITYNEIQKLYHDNNMQIIKHSYSLLMPIYIPYITTLINTHIEKHIKQLCFIEYFVARKNK